MELRVPSDKSISHRALMLSAFATGTSRVRGVLDAGDTRSTSAVLRELGARIPRLGHEELRIEGLGGARFKTPGGLLDCGNSGTTARLMLGALAASSIQATLTGDASLRSRPMGRVVDPLTHMGARFAYFEEDGRLPVQVLGSSLHDFDYSLPVASAQVKSALLLAGVLGHCFVLLREPGRSRDHTERMLGAMGASVVSHWNHGTWHVELRDPPETLAPLDVTVPGDFSSAAFLIVLATLRPTGQLTLLDVGLNPTRTGLLSVLARMGANVRVENERQWAGEAVGDVVVRASPLTGTTVEEHEIPGLIDEIPALAVAASRASGVTSIRGASELRVKESDRLSAISGNLRRLGVEVEEAPDGLDISGGSARLSGRAECFHDHRIAMAFGVLGAVSGGEIEIDDPGVAEVSYPGFFGLLDRLPAEAYPARRGGAGPDAALDGPVRPPVVTLDGPAGSGKSTTAKEVARRLGFRHLDSGALYRAITLALLESGVAETDWSRLDGSQLDGLDISTKPTDHGLTVLLGDRVVPDARLRESRVTGKVSVVAGLPAVRAHLLKLQKAAGEHGGLVADGRDMGTVVFPDAEVKVFLTANLEERARRRRLQSEGRLPTNAELAREEQAIQARDDADSTREVAPLRAPEGAVLLDTTGMAFEEQVERIVALVRGLTVQ